MGKESHGLTGLARIAAATRWSLAGLRAAWQGEAAFRQELAAGLLVIPGALILGRSATEQALLVAVWLLVLVTELLNTAVEATVNRIGAERHPLSGQAKDLGSAAVLVSIVLAVLVWASVAWERFA